MLRYCETKQFRGKSVTADPSPILNKLRYPKIIKHWKINIRIVSELSDKKFDRKSWYPPVLSSNSLTTGKCLIHSTEGFLYDLLRYCETKQVRRTIVTTAPSLIPYKFRYHKHSDIHKVSSTKVFGTVRQKFSDGKTWYSPSPLPYP